MHFHSQLQQKLTSHSLLWLVVFLAGVIAVSLPRAASSTSTPNQKSAPAAVAVRQITLATKDLVYDPVTQQIYASVPGSAGGIANTITRIDPVTGNVGASVAIGNEPSELAISNNSQYIYVALDGAAAVRRFDLATQTAGLQFSVGSGSSGSYFARDIAVVPGQADSVAIARTTANGFLTGVAIFDNGTARPTTTEGGPETPNNVIEFSGNASTLYGYTNSSSGFGFSKMAVNASGVSVVAAASNLISGFGVDIVYENGLLFATSGRVIDPETRTMVGVFADASGSAVLPDSSVNQVYFLTGTGPSTTLKSFNRTTFVQTGSLAIPTVSGTPGSLIKWGADNLAFRTSDDQIFFVSTSEIVPVAASPIPSPTQLPHGVIELPLTTNDLVYDPNTQKLYASLPSNAGTFGNSIAAINPQTGEMETPVFVGSEPRKLAIADSGQQLYAGLDGAAAVRRFDTVTQIPGLQFPLGQSSNGPMYVNDMAVLPGSPNSVAISRKNVGISPSHEGVAIYDDAVARALTTPGHTGANVIEFSSLASTLYGLNNETTEFGFYKLDVSASGVSTVSTTARLLSGFSLDFRYDNGLVYATNGRVINPETAEVVGTFSGASGLVVPDSAAGKVYFLNNSILTAYDAHTFLPTGSLTISGISGAAIGCIKWGANGLACRTPSQVLLISTSAIVPIPPTAIPQPVQVAAGVVRLPLDTNDLVYDANTQKVYVSLPGSAGSFGNSIAPVNPETGTMDAPVFIGSEPRKLAMSANNEFIYTGLDGACAVRRFEVASQTSTLQFALGKDPSHGPYTVEDLAVLPNDPNAVAVSRHNANFSPRHEGVAVYDSGVARPNVTTTFAGISNVIEFSSSASTLYGYNNETTEFGFRKMAVDANGVSITSTTTGLIGGFSADIKYDNERVYASRGEVINPNTATLAGTFADVDSLAFVPDSSINRAFFVVGSGGSVALRAFDLNTFQPVGSMNIPGVNGLPQGLVRWGTDGLAFRTTADEVFFIRTSLVSSAPNLLVNSLGDSADSSVGDGHCDTDGNLGNGDQCTLRAAIQEANAAGTDDAITFDVSLNSGSISLNTALDAINKNITITGPGASLLTVQRSSVGGTPDFRIFTINSGKTVTISGLTILNGRVTSANGAGISNSGSLTLNGLTISGNTIVGSGGGGGILNLATLTVNDCLVSGNLGSGILSSSFGANTSATINNSVIFGNTGSGVANNGANSIATMVINNSTISGNNANGGGGGISNGAGSFTSRAFLTVNNSTISGNSAGAGGGGGIYNAAVFGNAATEATINNSTISANVDTSNFGGGGIMSFGNSGGITTLTINGGTVFGNNTNAGNGGGIVSSNQGGPTTLNLRNTIVAGNFRNAGAITSDVNGVVDSAGSFNLIGDGTELAGLSNGSNGNQIGTAVAPIDPRLGPLANNGGPTQTHRLLTSSPALDAAADVALTTLNGAIDNSQTTIDVTNATSIPAGIGFVVLIDSEQLSVVSRSANTLTVVRGVSGTTAAAHASGTSLYATVDQRGAGFKRKRDSADVDALATVDIGAFEAQASIEDIGDKLIAEDTPLSFAFNLGDAGAITIVTAASSNSTLVPNSPANINFAGSGSTRTLNIVPTANQFGSATIFVTIFASSEFVSDSFDLTVVPVADTPSVTNATTNEDTQTSSGLVISRNALDGPEVSHFKITGITNGTLFRHDGVTPINNGDFILAAEGGDGLKFTPTANFFGIGSFNVQASVSNADAGLGGGIVTASITVNAAAEVPSVTNATTTVNTQTSSGLVVTPNAMDGPEITHFRIENIQNGTLFKNDGVTQITSLTTITVAEGAAGLKFTPGPNLFSPGTTFSFAVRGAMSAAGDGLGGAATATITVNCNSSSEVTNTNDSGAGSLRDAILQACPGSTITFNIPTGDPGFSGGVYSITLTSAALTIDRNLTITGLGAGTLKIQRSTAGGTPNFRIFTITSGNALTLSGVTLSNGNANGAFPANSGGGILVDGGTLDLSDSIVSGNRAVSGGGLYNNSGQVTIRSTTINTNTAANGAGGGVFNSSGTLGLTNTTLSANTADAQGGGLANSSFNGPAGVATLTNTTVSGNHATGVLTSGIGGIANLPGSTLSLTNCTVSGNTGVGSGGGGAGGINNGGTAALRNTIVAANTSGAFADLNGSFTSRGHNLIGTSNGTNGFTNGTNGDQVGSSPALLDPRLGPLANNGGPTQTRALLLSSPALDAGDNCVLNNSCAPGLASAITTDQRGAGFARGVDGPDADTTDTVDIGAYEAQVAVADITDQSINEDSALVLFFHVGGAANITGVTATSINTTLLPNDSAHLEVSGSGSVLRLVATPIANASGTSTITLTVNGNNSQSMTDTFVLTVNSVNDAPSFVMAGSQTVNENAGAQTVNNFASNISAGPPNEAAQSLTFVIVNNGNPGLFAVSPAISPTGTLTYTPATGASGIATISIALMDNGGTANGGINTSATQSFNITLLEGGALQFNSATFAAAEGIGNAVVTVTRTGGAAGEARVNYATSNGTATAGQDYTAASGTLIFPDGVTSKTFNVAITNDAVDEPDETINLTLTTAAGTGSLGTPAGAVLTITDNDPAPSISINDVSVTEGNSSTVNAAFTVSLSGQSAQTVTVNFATANGTATAGSDYQATSGTLTFLPLETTKPVSVIVNGDTSFEPNETFSVNLSSAVNASVGDSQGSGAITNDDAQGGFISFSQANYTVGESGGFVTITVNRSNDLSGPATVDYATADDSTVVPCSTANGIASSRCDFTTALGTLRFAAGESSKTFVVLISQDNYVEGPETLTITLSNLTGGAAFATPSMATLTITDDATEPAANPIDSADAFVRQHYHDFLNREADPAGLGFWTNQITECQQPGATCSAEVRRINVSAAFFLSIEFQETGYFVYRTYKSSYGNISGTPVPLRLAEFLPDTQQIGKGFVVGAPGAEQQLENNKVAYMQDFVARARFTTAYPTTMTPAEFVDGLFANSGVTPSATERNAAIGEFSGAGNTADTAARARALRRVAENATLKQQETNRAFVLMQYFGYLRRNPNDAPEANLDFGGYNFWLGKLNQFNGNFVEAEMVKAFIVSGEYRQRFGQ